MRCARPVSVAVSDEELGADLAFEVDVVLRSEGVQEVERVGEFVTELVSVEGVIVCRPRPFELSGNLAEFLNDEGQRTRPFGREPTLTTHLSDLLLDLCQVGRTTMLSDRRRLRVVSQSQHASGVTWECHPERVLRGEAKLFWALVWLRCCFGWRGLFRRVTAPVETGDSARLGNGAEWGRVSWMTNLAPGYSVAMTVGVRQMVRRASNPLGSLQRGEGPPEVGGDGTPGTTKHGVVQSVSCQRIRWAVFASEVWGVEGGPYRPR